MSVPQLTAADDERTLSLRVKDAFEIVLDGIRLRASVGSKPVPSMSLR